jgi:hypothetical protein
MSAAPLTLLVLALAGQVVELRSEKPFVTAEESARLEVLVRDDSGQPVRDANVVLKVNVGSVTQPVLEDDGVWRATWQPPAGEGPQVALFHAAVEQGTSRSVRWLSLPVHGRHLLRVQAPPRARVQVSLGGATFGPVKAEARGEASVPVVVPPGVTSAQVTTLSPSRRPQTQTVPLPFPASPRIWLVPPQQAPLGGRPVPLEGFVVDGEGRPATPLPPLVVSVRQGSLGPIQAKEGGTFEVAYTALRSGESPVDISVSTLAEPERPFTLQLEPRPAPPTAVASAAPPGPEKARLARWRPSVGLSLVAHGNGGDSKGLGLRLEGSLQLAGLPLEALVQLDGRRNAQETQDYSRPEHTPVKKVFSLGGFGARLGARFNQPLGSQGVLFTEASAGVLRMTGSVRLEGLQDAPEQPLESLGPLVAVGGGLGWTLGAGRVYGQVQWAYAPGQGTMEGNLGGLSVALGYQLPLGGGIGP